jgi:serine/threonine-protein kinase
VVRRFPVTNRQYIAFLDALVASGHTEEALRRAPQERAAADGDQGAPFYGFDGRRFSLRPDAQGDLWLPDWPVCMVDWYGASAFAAWEAAQTGLPWRLPGELVWEKAARGVDGRFYPWGDGFDPTWACMVQSHRDRILPASVGAFPIDESPYGVRDLAGGMQDWCRDAFGDTAVPQGAATASTGTQLRAIRGGSFGDAPSLLRAVFRYGQEPSARSSDRSFRLARSLG